MARMARSWFLGTLPNYLGNWHQDIIIIIRISLLFTLTNSFNCEVLVQWPGPGPQQFPNLPLYFPTPENETRSVAGAFYMNVRVPRAWLRIIGIVAVSKNLNEREHLFLSFQLICSYVLSWVVDLLQPLFSHLIHWWRRHISFYLTASFEEISALMTYLDYLI